MKVGFQHCQAEQGIVAVIILKILLPQPHGGHLRKPQAPMVLGDM
jgi:hypothetical protein